MGQNEWCAIVDVMSTSMHVVMLIGLIFRKLFLECASFIAI
jgi:ABC-type enterochelin transport system permease subunit